MIYGNIDGIKNSYIEQLEELYTLRVPQDSLLSEEVLNYMIKFTELTEKEISVGIDRKGKIVSVAIGDSTSVQIPLIDIKERKLSGVRIIHTHPSGNPKLSALDVSALLKLKLDAILAVGVDYGNVTAINIGFCRVVDSMLEHDEIKNLSIDEVINMKFVERVRDIENSIKENDVVEDNRERAIVVGTDTYESLDELKELVKACDASVLDSVFQKKVKIDPAFYIGRGKVDEISYLIQTKGANLVVFDDELSGSQIRNLESVLGVKVIDRTILILEIFATRARTREAKIQVELAQLKYRSSRLTGLGTVLSRTGGGIGTKGPGEKKLEIDRRRIKDDIYDLTQELKKIKKTREVMRENRSKQSVPQIALVGYTNAGKSTLRNKLCEVAQIKENNVKEKVFEANMLFATLDTTTRAIRLLDNRVATLTDTVGFVRKLPHELVEAFKSTLEEVISADVLCHVVDGSSETADEQIDAVEEVLAELGVREKPTVLAINKIDLCSEETLNKLREDNSRYDMIEISAVNDINLDELLRKVAALLPNKLKKVKMMIPYADQNQVAYLHRNANIFNEQYEEEGTMLEVEVDEEIYNKLNNYIIEEL